MSTGTVLFVEDNPFTRKIVRFALEKNGYTVLEADTGALALSLFASGQPDLVLQDIVLPDIDGFELVRRLRSLPRGAGVPVLAFSAHLSKLEVARDLSVGFDAVIAKPIEPARLIPIIDAHLGMTREIERFGAGLRAVVADDDPIQLKLTRFQLERVGFSVEPTADGHQALEAARRAAPTCIVADVLMPRLDGFGLALAARQEPSLATVPVVLLSSSYVDTRDRDLARRVGANRLVLRTPDHRELLQALREVLSVPRAAPDATPNDVPQLEQERASRAADQLERQVLLNNVLAHRCSALSAELTVLAGISEALVRHSNLEQALDEAVAACLDIGGIAVGALYLVEPDGTLRCHSVTGQLGPGRALLSSFFGREDELRRLIDSSSLAIIPSSGLDGEWASDVLERCAAAFALLVPIVHRGSVTGGLFMAVKADAGERQDWLVLGQRIGNQIAQALALARAFTDKHRAERIAAERAEQLRASEERFRATFEQAAVGVAQVAADGRWLDVNQRLCDIVGYTRAELLERTFQQITYWEDVDADLQLVHQILTGQIQSYTLEKRYVHKNGSLVWIDLTVSLVKDETGPKYFVSIVQDISARKSAEAEAQMAQRLRRANEELQAAYRELQATQAQLVQSAKMASLGELVAGVAHEINNPLAFVISHIDTTGKSLQQFRTNLNEPVSAVSEEHWRKAQTRLSETLLGLQRIRDLVIKLRTFSRFDEGESKLVSVKESLDAVLMILHHRLAGRIEVIVSNAASDSLECYPALFNQVLLNLVSNSIDAIQGPGTISISSRIDGNDYCIAVADTGSGIAPAIRDRVMEPFFTTKGVGQGTGLGLSIAHSIVKQHAGTLTLGDAPGGGTVATIRIPFRAR